MNELGAIWTNTARKNMGFSMDDYMTVREVAVYFGKDEGTIRQWVRDGYLDQRRSGPGKKAQILIPRKSVERLEKDLSRGPVIR